MRRMLAVLLLAAGCAPAPGDGLDPTTEAAQPVYQGQPATGDAAVVALVSGPYSFCSGTLITPNVVLTAAHCLPPNNPGEYTDIDIFFGSQVGDGIRVDVIDGWTHPFWDDDEIYFDIGLLRLAEAAPVAPIPFNIDESLLDIGDPVRIVGFGITGTNQGGGGLKREGAALVDDKDQHVLVLSGDPSGTCSGDSGGSAITDVNGVDTLVGVHSRADCEGLSIEMRTDVYEAYIVDFIGDPECQLDGICWLNCPFVDPDCPCAKDGFCTDACEDRTQDLDCPDLCASDDYCNPTCETDPDCACIADGVCAEGCSADPDCRCAANGFCNATCEPGEDPDCSDAPSCVSDGLCDEGCADDPDCELAAAPPVSAAPQQTGGCGVGPAPSRGSAGWGWASLFALGMLRRRRR